MAGQSSEAVGKKKRWGVAVDLKRCVGCQSCTVTCKAENATPPGVFWTRVVTKEEGKFPIAYRVFMPLRCNHCSEPPCVPVCPTGASHQRENDNIVLVNQDICVGCHSCVVACPYQMRFLPDDDRGYYGDKKTPFEEAGYKKWQAGTTQKCTLCIPRLVKGLQPACVDTCPSQAMTFGDLNDPDSKISRQVASREHFRPQEKLGTDPNTIYLT